MAAAAAAVAATQPSSSENATDGPVLNLINKRLRALRKKLNRISQMEESVSQGKALNKEQEETLRSKSSVLAGIDELEKLRHPLLQAVDQEIELALGKIKPNPGIDITDIPSEAAAVEAEAKSGTVPGDSVVSDLLILLYFGTIFDVKTLYLARDNMLTRTHERNCCLTYDCITDDDAAGDLLKDQDLDSIAMLGGLLLSRPVNSTLSHMNALQKCVEHAKLWLANVEQPIEPGSNVTYAGLREKLHKIMASEYFTTTPEIKDAGEVAAAGGNYASFQVSVNRQEEEEVPDSREAETYIDESQRSSNAGIDQDSRDVDSKKQNTTRDKSQPGFQGGRGRGGRRGYGSGHGGGRGGSYQNGREQGVGSYYQPSDYGYGRRGGRGFMGGGNYNHHGPAGGDYAQAAS